MAFVVGEIQREKGSNNEVCKVQLDGHRFTTLPNGSGIYKMFTSRRKENLGNCERSSLCAKRVNEYTNLITCPHVEIFIYMY